MQRVFQSEKEMPSVAGAAVSRRRTRRGANSDLRGTRGRDSSSLSETAYRTIEQGLITGRWQPGEAISEQELASELGMSRTPIRETLRALARDGLVKIYARRGTFVTELTHIDVRDYYELREALEVQIARLAAQRATPDDLAELAALEVRGREADDPLELEEAGVEFHLLLARITRNRRLAEALASVLRAVRLARLRDYRGLAEGWRHSPYIEAIRSGDGDLAAQVAQAHAREVYARLLRP